ncbi:MAG: bacteriophage Gp15 family protein [Lachnospiraceae bacterium]|nr:bacteriophage Gp15 family protein [Lachnospiraceae bacterium]
MSVLTVPFPTRLQIGGVNCPIHSDFRTVLRCYEILGEKKELSKDEMVEMLSMFYVRQQHYTEEHIDKMFWFFSCGREKEKKVFPRKIAGINNKQSFDFVEDAELIYAGFMQQYGIDLQTEKMHWWKFMILLENLGSDTKLQRVMEYRTIDTKNKDLSKKEREFYSAMQRYFALERKIPEMPDKVKRIEEALLKGEDISGLL